MKTWMFDYISPAYEYAQNEIAGLCIRIGNRAWVFGRYDYREKNCPWPLWARVHIVLGHKPYPDCRRRWKLRMFRHNLIDIGGR